MKIIFSFLIILVFSCVNLFATSVPLDEVVTKYEAEYWDVVKKDTPSEMEIVQMGRRFAQVHGIAIIDPIMEKSKFWKGEEPLLYMPIVLALPLDDAIKKFGEYMKSEDKRQKLYAREFLVEIEMHLYNLQQQIKEAKKTEKDTPGKGRGDHR